MAYSAPTTRATGFLVTAAVWNQDVVDNVTFLANAPGCRAFHNTTNSITSGTEMTLAFNSEQFDNDGMHSMSVNTERITITTAGVYVFTWGFQLSSDTDYTAAYSYLRINGTTIAGHGSTLGTYGNATGPLFTGSAIYKCVATDYFEVRANQTNTSAGANTTGANTTFYAAQWTGLG